jgi:hypothetical protein
MEVPELQFYPLTSKRCAAENMERLLNATEIADFFVFLLSILGDF